MPLSVITQDDFKPRTADQAARHFARKAVLTSDQFDVLSNEARGHAFRISGVHKVNMVQRARSIIHKAILEGTPYADVQRLLLSLYDTEGVPRSSLARLRTMFGQNSHQAYNDGRREALDEPDMMEGFPFRQYLTIGNGTPGYRGVRPTHAALHNLVFAADDPFWDSHTPPWEFGCRCFFRALTARQAKGMGVKVRSESYVRKQLRVPGESRRGVAANPQFVRGGVDLRKIDEELRDVMREYQA